MFGLVPAAAYAVAAHPVFVLAAANDPGGHGDDFGKSSPLGLLVLVLFLISTAFLVRSMNKHLKKVPASFDPPAESDSADPAEDRAQQGGQRGSGE